DASGFGEGEVYAGSQDVTTDAAGNASFSFALTGTFTGQVFTVTATNKATGDTSEFAQDKGATAAALTLSVTPNLFSEGAGNNAAVGTVTRNTFTGVPLVVTLTSSTSRVKVPASITIPAGANSSTFSIDAVDNRAVDASQTVTITAGATGLPTATATLTVTDNDTPGITVTPTTGLVTTEAGGKASFQVVLNTQPTAAVSLGLSSSNTGEGTVAPATLTFTPQNWDQPQTVTVTGVDDTLADGNQPYTIVTAPATSTDPNYNKLDAADVSVINQDNESPTLTLSANPITIVEGASTTLTLTRNTPTGAALSVTLSSDNSGLPVPGSVTIPAGQASVTLSVTATDDTVVNGTRTATISASVSGFTGSNVAITITDNDVVTVPASLTVTLSPATVSEAAGVSASHGTVTRHDAPTTAPLSVQITTDQPGKARSAITTVIIPAGKTSTTFAIDAVDNNLVDGSQAVTFTATTDGFLPGTAILTVTDDDKPTLTLSITPTRLRETGGARAGQGTVSRNTATDKPLVVQLSSSNTTKLRVPPSVIIPAGANVATFAVTTINDNQPKGPRLVTIAARAPDFVSGTAQAIVTDAAPASNLSFGGQVTVVASSVAPGAPTGIGGATVTLLQKGIILDEVQTDASGHYQFTNLPVGSYTVTVQKDSYTSFSPASRTVEISPKGAPTHNDFVGTPQGSFSGRITQRLEDGTVQGVAGVTITAYSTGGVLTGRTGSTGQYTLTTAFVGPWLVVPVLRGTYFEPTTRVAALSPTTPVSTGLGFTATGTDVINPTVTILTPRPGSYKLSNQPTQATGTATDKGGAGMAVVTVALARFATATSKVPTGFWNWKANSFISTDNPLLVERLATGTTNWNLSGLPKLAAGFYGLRATALDGADNRIVSPFVRYSITGASAVAVEAGRAGASAIALSNASAQTATATIQLRFLGALEPESASDATHYTVTVNGRSVTVETAGYDVAHQTVTLSLPVGALQTGDTVAVQWSDLLDMQQQTLNGAVSLHAAP
ncbi:MAG: carboxypeptidase regulatory-like domain-containing protein, partial [Abitibacteriaceae bacterium]|nr:carboxypeptidase regulatory-like domain-containing protein [Abditibacteriaceae bacterium]